MPLKLWGTSRTDTTPTLISNLQLNDQGYALMKGISGAEDTILLANWVDATFVLAPNSAPSGPNARTLWVKNFTGATQLAVDIFTGNTTISNLVVTGTASINVLPGAGTNQPSLVVTGTASINNLYGATATIGSLEVTGAATLNTTLDVLGNVDIEGNIDVAGTATINSTLFVGGAATFNAALNTVGATTLAGTLTTLGAATLNSTLAVTGAATINNLLAVNGRVVLQSPIGYIQGGTTSSKFIDSTATIDHFTVFDTGGVYLGTGDVGADPGANNLAVQGGVRIAGAATINSTLFVAGAATFNTTLSVTGAATFNAALNTVGATTHAAGLTTLGAATFNSTLSVTGAATFNSTLALAGGTTPTADGVLGYAAHLHNAGDGTINRPLALYKIGEVVTAASASQVTFSAIPAFYRHLRLEAYVQVNGGGGTGAPLMLQFNGDTANHYGREEVSRSGSTVAATNFANNTVNAHRISNNGNATITTAFIIDIPYYANANANQFIHSDAWNDVQNGLGSDGLWSGAAAVTSILIFMTGSGAAPFFVNGSIIELFGIA